MKIQQLRSRAAGCAETRNDDVRVKKKETENHVKKHEIE